MRAANIPEPSARISMPMLPTMKNSHSDRRRIFFTWLKLPLARLLETSTDMAIGSPAVEIM